MRKKGETWKSVGTTTMRPGRKRMRMAIGLRILGITAPAVIGIIGVKVNVKRAGSAIMLVNVGTFIVCAGGARPLINAHLFQIVSTECARIAVANCARGTNGGSLIVGAAVMSTIGRRKLIFAVKRFTAVDVTGIIGRVVSIVGMMEKYAMNA